VTGAGAGWLAPRLPLRFDEFQRAALYDPENGFYGAARGRAGRRRGDFITSPEVGPLFGAVLAAALDRWWEEWGRPRPFTVIECGAGAGTLARAVAAARPASAPRYVTVEVSAGLRALHPEGVTPVAAFPAPERGVGVVVANELLDNLPVRLVEPGGEVWVGTAGEELRGTDLVRPSRGRRPVAAEARAWVERARLSFDAGRVVAFDYGVEATEEMESRPPLSWLRTYRAHGSAGDYWLSPGTADITC
jgi:SAM-dependent MidA family methyltransferase